MKRCHEGPFKRKKLKIFQILNGKVVCLFKCLFSLFNFFFFFKYKWKRFKVCKRLLRELGIIFYFCIKLIIKVTIAPKVIKVKSFEHNLCIHHNHRHLYDYIFFFNDKIHSQIDGEEMGHPLGPTFANLFISPHELNWLQNCPNHFKPKFNRRYVDDTFILFSDASHVLCF